MKFDKTIKAIRSSILEKKDEKANPVMRQVDGVATVCAYCDRDKTVTDALRKKGIDVSHGICPHCNGKEEKKLAALLKNNPKD